MAARARSLQLRNLTRATVIADHVATADTFWTRFVGLMGREVLPPGEALWLPGVNNIHMFFMRFPIDACFVGPPAEDGSRAVVAVREQLPAWRGIVWYVRGARGVFELPAGTLAEAATRPGDRLLLTTPDAPHG